MGRVLSRLPVFRRAEFSYWVECSCSRPARGGCAPAPPPPPPPPPPASASFAVVLDSRPAGPVSPLDIHSLTPCPVGTNHVDIGFFEPVSTLGGPLQEAKSVGVNGEGDWGDVEDFFWLEPTVGEPSAVPGTGHVQRPCALATQKDLPEYIPRVTPTSRSP